MSRTMERELANPRNFGMAKSFVMGGMAAGFDMTTGEGMGAFTRLHNASLSAAALGWAPAPGGLRSPISLLVDDAARIDDPEVQAAIDAAFDEDRVFTDFICRSDIERIRGEPRWSIPTDLEDPMTYFHSGALASMKQSWEAARRRATQAVRASQAPTGSKVGRNDPCPCGSGKKYKKCCLR